MTANNSQTNNTNPTVSVCMTSYNHAKFVGKAIISVLSQTFMDFEFIILEHASTDNSLEIIKSFEDKRIKLIIWEKNYHSTFAANELLKTAKGRYLAFICSDDAWHPEKLAEQIRFLEINENIAVAFTRIDVIDENDNIMTSETPYHYYFNREGNRDKFSWLRFCYDFLFNPFCCSSAMVRKSVYDDIGPFEVRSRNMQDFIMWVSILFKYDVHILEKKLTIMRYFYSNSNVTGNTVNHHIIVCNEAKMHHELFIENMKDLSVATRVFPEIKVQFTNLDSLDIPFYLAIIGIEAQRIDLRAYSLDILYGLMKSDENRSHLKQKYNFGHMDLYKISERTDIYRQKQMAIDYTYSEIYGVIKYVLVKMKLLWLARLLFKIAKKCLKSLKFETIIF